MMGHATWLTAAVALGLAAATGAGAEPRFKPGAVAIVYDPSTYRDGPEKGVHIHVRVAIDRDAYLEYAAAIRDGTGGAAMVEAGELLELPSDTRVRVVAWHALRKDPGAPDAYEAVVLHGDHRGRTIWVHDYKLYEPGKAK